MAKKPQVIVTKENKTGRNTGFKDTKTNKDMTRAEFVKKIKDGKYEDFHIRNINGVETPVSNPDSDPSNNLE